MFRPSIWHNEKSKLAKTYSRTQRRLTTLGAFPNPACRRCVSRATHPGFGRWHYVSRDCQKSKNQFAHHRPLEDAVRTRRIGGVGRPSSGQPAACRDAEGASTRDPASAAKARGQQHALVLPETGERVGAQQVHGAEDSGPRATESTPTDIIGLYLHPPQHAAVFCLDEKTAIQALDRLDPVLPLSPGRAERHGFEYYRHGTLSLYAALDVKTGKVEGKTAR